MIQQVERRGVAARTMAKIEVAGREVDERGMRSALRLG